MFFRLLMLKYNRKDYLTLTPLCHLFTICQYKSQYFFETMATLSYTSKSPFLGSFRILNKSSLEFDAFKFP